MGLSALADIQTGRNKVFVMLDALETASVVASKHGFFDLDVDTGPQGIKIVATSAGRSLTVNGKTTAEAVERLIDVLYG